MKNTKQPEFNNFFTTLAQIKYEEVKKIEKDHVR